MAHIASCLVFDEEASIGQLCMVQLELLQQSTVCCDSFEICCTKSPWFTFTSVGCPRFLVTGLLLIFTIPYFRTLASLSSHVDLLPNHLTVI